MDYKLPGSSVHRVLWARVLVWVATPFSRGSFGPRDRTRVSCIAGLSHLLKDDAVKVLHSIWKFGKFGKLSSGHRTGKGWFSLQSQRRAMPKNVQTTVQLCSFHILARLCSKTCKPGFSSMWTKNLQMFKLDLASSWKGRGTRDHIANIHWIIEKARELQKNIYFCFTDQTKAFDCVDHNKLWNILILPEYPSYLPPEKPVCRSRTNS